MRIFELVVAGLFLLGGLRSIWYWSRRPFEGTSLLVSPDSSVTTNGSISL